MCFALELGYNYSTECQIGLYERKQRRFLVKRAKYYPVQYMHIMSTYFCHSLYHMKSKYLSVNPEQ